MIEMLTVKELIDRQYKSFDGKYTKDKLILSYISDKLYDYDGCVTVRDFKMLIDHIREVTKLND